MPHLHFSTVVHKWLFNAEARLGAGFCIDIFLVRGLLAGEATEAFAQDLGTLHDVDKRVRVDMIED